MAGLAFADQQATSWPGQRRREFELCTERPLPVPTPDGAPWLRRARPLLGTLVEIGVPAGHESALAAAWAAMAQVQQLMSAHDGRSDLSRSHQAQVGEAVPVHAWTAEVLQLAAQLHAQTDGLFDVALGTGRWALQPALPARQQRQQGAGHALIRLDAGTRLDLGGIAKGWAVDQAVRAAQAAGAPAVWVNAGGDLRAQGVAVPVVLRDERHGGVRPWATLQDGAMATSDFALGARSALWGAVACHGRREASADDSADADADADAVQQWGRKQPMPMRHVSVAAPCCAWADALTKIVALAGQLEAPLVQRLLASYQAQAWLHNASPSP